MTDFNDEANRGNTDREPPLQFCCTVFVTNHYRQFKQQIDH